MDDIVRLTSAVLEETLDIATVPQIQDGRRYLRAFLAGESYAERFFKPNALARGRLSMLSLAVRFIRPHWHGERAEQCLNAIIEYINLNREPR